MRIVLVLAIGALLLPAIVRAASPAPLESIRAALAPANCVSNSVEALDRVDAAVASLRKSLGNAKKFARRADEWLVEERKSGKDVPELNWIRLLDPSSLPGGFPARPGFERCDGRLQAIRDALAVSPADPVRSSAAYAGWDDCVGLLFPKGRPDEAIELGACLRAATAPTGPAPTSTP
ncbi:MAG: hypothetical protein JST04_05800 [Bdellovibrionales bacterium]|nr:hypothetical protein [Bdellovibrionales bacterium]